MVSLHRHRPGFIPTPVLSWRLGAMAFYALGSAADMSGTVLVS